MHHFFIRLFCIALLKKLLGALWRNGNSVDLYGSYWNCEKKLGQEVEISQATGAKPFRTRTHLNDYNDYVFSRP